MFKENEFPGFDDRPLNTEYRIQEPRVPEFCVNIVPLCNVSRRKVLACNTYTNFYHNYWVAWYTFSAHVNFMTYSCERYVKSISIALEKCYPCH